MFLESLAEHPTLQAAAEAAAGNWKDWQCFVWFGSDEIPDNHNVALGYLVTYDASLRQLTNLEFVKQELKAWWGDLRRGGLVDDFGSSVWGDKDALNGIMIRVFVDGRISYPFARLYTIALDLKHSDDLVIDQDVFERVQRREMLRYVYSELEYECRKRGLDFTPELAEEVTDSMIENEVDFDNDDLNSAIAEEMGWKHASEARGGRG